MTVDRDTFRALVSSFPSGVTVVTAYGSDGEPYGATVSAFSSMSMEPPLIIVSLQSDGRMAALMHDCAGFAVNVLREDQKEIALQFARPGDRFRNIETRECDVSAGVPVLCDTLATILCRASGSFVVGDHTVFIGEVVGGRVREGAPLIHGFGHFACMREL